MITKEIAVALPLGTTLYHTTLTNADGTPMRCRVNGKCKTWKTRPDDFQLPVKHGLRDCFYITHRGWSPEHWLTTSQLTALESKGMELTTPPEVLHDLMLEYAS